MSDTIYSGTALNDAICHGTGPSLRTVVDVVDFLSDVVADHVMIETAGAGVYLSRAEFDAEFDRTFAVAWPLLMARLDRFMPDTARRVREGIAAGALD